MRSTLAYTTARILLFVAATGLLYLAGLRSVLLLGAALLVSGIFSYVVLSRQRDAMSSALTSRLHSFRGRLDAGSRAEDDDYRRPVSPGSQPPSVSRCSTASSACWRVSTDVWMTRSASSGSS